MNTLDSVSNLQIKESLILFLIEEFVATKT